MLPKAVEHGQAHQISQARGNGLLSVFRRQQVMLSAPTRLSKSLQQKNNRNIEERKLVTSGKQCRMSPSTASYVKTTVVSGCLDESNIPLIYHLFKLCFKVESAGVEEIKMGHKNVGIVRERTVGIRAGRQLKHFWFREGNNFPDT